MPILGSSAPIKNNLLTGISLQGVTESDLSSGQVQWSLSLENYPSGSISFENLLESQAKSLKAKYVPLRKKITIEGIPFQVVQFQYSRTGYSHREERFSTYTASISLAWYYQFKIAKNRNVKKLFGKKKVVTSQDFAGKIGVPYEGPSFDITLTDKESISFESELREHSKVLGKVLVFDRAVRLIDLSSSKSYHFDEIQVLQDGGNNIGLLPTYKDTILTWNDTPDLIGEDGERLTRNGPIIETIIKQDKNPESPPLESISLRTLDSNFNHSGPTKTKTISKVVDGNTQEENTFVYGFAYTSEDILTDGEVLEGNPYDFWQVVEESKSYKVYDKIWSNIPTFSKIPRTEGKNIIFIPNPNQTLPLVVSYTKDDSYVHLNVTVTPDTEYLVKEVTEGKKKFQFLQETEELEAASLAETKNQYQLDAQLYELYQFKSLPTIEEKAYLLTSTRALNKRYPNPKKKGENALPYQIEVYTSINDAPREVQDAVKNIPEFDTRRAAYDPTTQIGVVSADVGYIEPYSVITESSRKSAFAFIKHPEPENELQPYIITGEESYHIIERKMVKFNRYQQITSEFSSQNSGFSDAYSKIYEEDVLGEMPSASTITPQWESEEPLKDTDPTKKKIYLLTSDYVTEHDTSEGSLNIPLAKTKEDAVRAAKFLLRIAGLSASTVQRTYAWYYPSIRPGDKIVTGKDLFSSDGDWRVTNITFSVVYKGDNRSSTLVAYPIIQTDGTNITLGLDKQRSVSVTEKEDSSSRDISEDPVNETNGYFPNIGEVILNRPNRRKFS